MSTFKTFLLSLSSIHRTNNYYFLPQMEMQRAKCPFSHKLKLTSLISLYNFIANISFLLLFVNYFIFSSREMKWKRKGKCYTLILLEISRRIRWWCLKCVIVYLTRDIPPFVMYCVNGKPRSSLLTDCMIILLQWT